MEGLECAGEKRVDHTAICRSASTAQNRVESEVDFPDDVKQPPAPTLQRDLRLRRPPHHLPIPALSQLRRPTYTRFVPTARPPGVSLIRPHSSSTTTTSTSIDADPTLRMTKWAHSPIQSCLEEQSLPVMASVLTHPGTSGLVFSLYVPTLSQRASPTF